MPDRTVPARCIGRLAFDQPSSWAGAPAQITAPSDSMTDSQMSQLNQFPALSRVFLSPSGAARSPLACPRGHCAQPRYPLHALVITALNPTTGELESACDDHFHPSVTLLVHQVVVVSGKMAAQQPCLHAAPTVAAAMPRQWRFLWF